MGDCLAKPLIRNEAGEGAGTRDVQLGKRAMPVSGRVQQAGHFVLQVTGHPEFGVPFGRDRIVPIFLATLAVRQKSQAGAFPLQKVLTRMRWWNQARQVKWLSSSDCADS